MPLQQAPPRDLSPLHPPGCGGDNTPKGGLFRNGSGSSCYSIKSPLSTASSFSVSSTGDRTPSSPTSAEPPETDDNAEQEKDKSSSSSVWKTTNKVLGVNTVLGTAGLTSASITLPSLGGGIVGGCAAAAIGVATAASLVTGVGVLAGMGVAGVKYAKKKKSKREKEELDKKEEKANLERQNTTESLEEEEEGEV